MKTLIAILFTLFLIIVVKLITPPPPKPDKKIHQQAINKILKDTQ
jgi:hypothetical protein